MGRRNGCDADIARSLGADMAVTGTVQKVSNLILNVNIYTRDAATGERTAAMSVDIRGNTDKSWLRGVSYLVRNRLAADPAPELGWAAGKAAVRLVTRPTRPRKYLENELSERDTAPCETPCPPAKEHAWTCMPA